MAEAVAAGAAGSTEGEGAAGVDSTEAAAGEGSTEAAAEGDSTEGAVAAGSNGAAEEEGASTVVVAAALRTKAIMGPAGVTAAAAVGEEGAEDPPVAAETPGVSGAGSVRGRGAALRGEGE